MPASEASPEEEEAALRPQEPATDPVSVPSGQLGGRSMTQESECPVAAESTSAAPKASTAAARASSQKRPRKKSLADRRKHDMSARA